MLLADPAGLVEPVRSLQPPFDQILTSFLSGHIDKQSFAVNMHVLGRAALCVFPAGQI